MLVLWPGSCCDRRDWNGPQPEHPTNHLQLSHQDPIDGERRERDERDLGVAGLTNRRQSRKVKSRCHQRFGKVTSYKETFNFVVLGSLQKCESNIIRESICFIIFGLYRRGFDSPPQDFFKRKIYCARMLDLESSKVAGIDHETY